MSFMIPDRLLLRTALLFALLLIVGQIVWVAVSAGLYLQPIRMEYAQLLAGQVNMARAALVGRERGVSLEQLRRESGVTIESGDERARDAQLIAPKALASWEAEVRNLAGQDVELRTDVQRATVWIRFLAGGAPYWLVTPIVPLLSLFSTALLLTATIAVLASLAGAYLLIARLNKHLQAVVQAARTLGRGEIPARLTVAGPLEIRELSHGFNQMSEGLQRLASERRLMLAGISHDLRTPLARLRLGVELSAPLLKPAHAIGMVQDIAEMDAILDEFLSFARHETEEAPQLCDVDALVAEVCARHRLAGHEIGTTLCSAGPVRLRALAVRRLIANLVDNAVRYGKSGVEVATSSEAHRIVLTVADRGAGCHAAPGLGLTVVEKIARAHGGSVELHNRDDGGLLVTVVLMPVH